MKGAILGDILGSVYEFHTIKTKQFTFFKHNNTFTDDTVMTCAIASALKMYIETKNIDDFKKAVISEMKRLHGNYPDAGYGSRFDEWASSEDNEPYNSYGNGGAMRTSPVAFVAKSLDEALALAAAQAEVTHNHEEGIKGAKAITACIYLAKEGYDDDYIREYINTNFYDISFTVKETYRKYQYDISAMGSVPQSIVSYLEGIDYEDCVRNAISYGGDTDTMACMTGAIAEVRYGIPKELEKKMYEYLPDELISIVDEFYKLVMS